MARSRFLGAVVALALAALLFAVSGLAQAQTWRNDNVNVIQTWIAFNPSALGSITFGTQNLNIQIPENLAYGARIFLTYNEPLDLEYEIVGAQPQKIFFGSGKPCSSPVFRMNARTFGTVGQPGFGLFNLQGSTLKWTVTPKCPIPNSGGQKAGAVLLQFITGERCGTNEFPMGTTCCGRLPSEDCGRVWDSPGGRMLCIKGFGLSIWGYRAFSNTGRIYKGDCPQKSAAEFATDGVQIGMCGNIDNVNVQAVKKLVANDPVLFAGVPGRAPHGYFCDGDQLFECVGRADRQFICMARQPSAQQNSDMSYSCRSTRVRFLGDSLIREETEETWYCADTRNWVNDLDAEAVQGTCTAAGFIATGTKCCEDPETEDEYYNDANGGCFASEFVAGAGLLEDNRILYSANPTDQGFKGCGLSAGDPLLQLTDSFTGQLLVQNIQPCTSVLFDVAGERNAICQDNGEWAVTEEFADASPTLRQHTPPFDVSPGQQQTGCCPQNMCWDGATCVPPQTIYGPVGEIGYRCEV